MISLEGVRKLLQDIVTPDVRALSERVDALAKQQTVSEATILRQMVQMEERIMLQLKVATLTAENQELRARVGLSSASQQ